MRCVEKIRCQTNQIPIQKVCVGPCISISTRPFQCSTMSRHDWWKLEGTTLWRLKSRSGIKQIQRQLNRDGFGGTRMTFHNVSNTWKRLRKKRCHFKQENALFIKDVPRLLCTRLRRCVQWSYKHIPATEREIANELGARVEILGMLSTHHQMRLRKKSRKFISLINPRLTINGNNPACCTWNSTHENGNELCYN